MNTSILLHAIAAYITGAIFIGVPMAAASIIVWRKGVLFRHREGQWSDYTGGFWGYVLFPKSAITESLGRHASEPPGIRIVGLGTRRRYRAYLVLTMMLWFPRICCNVLLFVFLMLCGLFLFTLDCVSPQHGDALTTYLRRYITRVDRF